jgi:outer membrane protein assembly factor BamE (lipoprotein component of BamABCDE complex)
MKNILIFFIVVICFFCIASFVTEDQYKQLRLGMEYDEAVKILGKPGKTRVFKRNLDDRIFFSLWMFRKDYNVGLIFQDERMIAKISDSDDFVGKHYDDIVDRYGKPDRKFRYVLENDRQEKDILLCGWQIKNLLLVFVNNGVVCVGELSRFNVK